MASGTNTVGRGNTGSIARCPKPVLQLFAALAGMTAGLAAASHDFRVANENGSAWIGIAGPRYAQVLLDSDQLSGRVRVAIDARDLGKRGEIYLAAKANGQWFMKGAGGWKRWDGNVANLEPASARLLDESMEEISAFNGLRLPAGSYALHAAYTAGNGSLVLQDQPLVFEVQPAGRESLQRFASEAAMEAYLKEALVNGSRDPGAYLPFVALREGVVTAAADSASSGVSGTNVQVAGVDEADVVKTDGEVLYALQNCDQDACLKVYGLDGQAPAATPLATLGLKNEVRPDGMYLLEDRNLLVTVGGRNNFGFWFDIWGWGNGRTEVEFFDTQNPAALVSRERLTLDGSLVASRVVGDTLYLVTRFTPAVEGFQPYPLGEKEEESNRAVLADVTLPDLLPRVVDSRDEARELIASKDCYLPTSAVDESLNPSIITITSVPLSAPGSLRSTCFLGGSETLYMTPRSLYLATTSHEYSILAREALVYQADHSTAIHKFALAGGAIEYRGSGEVEGHLGWNEDYKSFRLGENGDYLNVVASTGETWDGSASTTLHVLAETAGNSLETVATLRGIGKPGEQLYGARFLGDRAFLVTFRLTDPLYVVDLSNQRSPRIAGELEVEGYSEYLHPVSENLLLGIGKDAVPDPGTGGDGGRGAFAQGLKLSLFDVSNPAAMRELDTVVLGKRGTESPVLWDHHAFSFLPGGGGEPMRVAIPVQLHDKAPDWEGFDASQPDAWYAYTHTALYAFEVSELGIARTGRIIGSVAQDFPERPIPVDIGGGIATSPAADGGEKSTEPAEPDVVVDPLPSPGRMILPWVPSYPDRSVLIGDAVFYLHDGEVLSARWGESR